MCPLLTLVTLHGSLDFSRYPTTGLDAVGSIPPRLHPTNLDVSEGGTAVQRVKVSVDYRSHSHELAPLPKNIHTAVPLPDCCKELLLNGPRGKPIFMPDALSE